jgi:hypothetical protein
MMRYYAAMLGRGAAMTTIRQSCGAIVATVLLAACGAADDDARPAPPPVKDSAFGDMVGTMDRARGVQDTTLQHKDDLDRELQQQEGADGTGDQ